jgi:hypothetical protein
MKNLNYALHNLWNAAELTSKVFWIDQICIHQEGEEKGHQVGLMGQIYKNAARVITYTGPAGDEEVEREGERLLVRFNRHFAPNYELLSQIEHSVEAHIRRLELPVIELPNDLSRDVIEKRVWEWLILLCFNEWGRRLWIVQEQLLNIENLVMRGPKILPWEIVVVVPMLYYLDFIPDYYVYDFW